MDQDKLYEDLQGTKVGFILTLLVLIYCFAELIDFSTAHQLLKEGFTIGGFLVISVITAHLLIRVVELKRAINQTAQAPGQTDNR